MLDLFCKVIDNYGDAGFCLRLCRDLTRYERKVRLFCDNLDVLRTIITNDDLSNPLLQISEWPYSDYQPSDTVIEAFSCRPEKYLLEKIKERKSRVIELDYLSAEKWIEGCHKKPSFSDGINSFFFFPGFTKNSGGLIIEDDYLQKIKNHSKNFTNKLTVSYFSYLNKNLEKFIKVCQNSSYSFEILAFDGLPLRNLNNILGTDIAPSENYVQGNITFTAKEMVPQNEYDDILISSDLNLVRGEDSIVRAMISGRPFLWQIYPQTEDTHREKMNALFDRMNEILPSEKKTSIERLRELNLSYVGYSDYLENFSIDEFFEEWKKISKDWSDYLVSLGSLTKNLIDFIDEIK